MNRRGAAALASLALLFIAVTLPTSWYDTIPRLPDSPPLPVSGVTILKLTIAIEALAFALLALRDWSFVAEPDPARNDAGRIDSTDDVSRRFASVALVAITLLALVARCISLGSDLWIDEITPIFDYGSMPVAQVIGSYLRSNNHLLNTLLMKAAISVFGVHEWSVRLPAVAFGVATVPVLYWIARQAMSRLAGLGAALLLALSYYHIFFSQNARGYTAYLFFALLSTGAFARAMQRDEMRLWILYVCSVVLGFASLITTGFVFAAQILVGTIAIVRRRRRGLSASPLIRHFSAACLIAAFLSFQLYAASLPEAYVVITSLYTVHGTTYAAFSTDFVRDAIRGMSAGLIGTTTVFLFLLIGAAGYATFVAASWLIALTLGFTVGLAAGLLAARGLTFSPRFFLIGLPLAILSVMSLDEAVAAFAHRRFALRGIAGRLLIGGLTVCVAAVFVVSLPRYYRTPKQPYRAALTYVEHSLRPGDAAAVIYVAESGFRYYVPRQHVRDPGAYHYVRTAAGLDSLFGNATGRRLFLVTTLPGILRQYIPDLSQRITQCCEVIRVFPGTLGDGDITIWEERASVPRLPISQ